MGLFTFLNTEVKIEFGKKFRSIIDSYFVAQEEVNAIREEILDATTSYELKKGFQFRFKLSNYETVTCTLKEDAWHIHCNWYCEGLSSDTNLRLLYDEEFSVELISLGSTLSILNAIEAHMQT